MRYDHHLEYLQYQRRQYIGKYTWIGIPVLILVLLGYNFYQNPDSTITLNHNGLQVHSIYGAKISYREITQMNLVRNLPKIKSKTNGLSLFHYDKGHFELNKVGKAELWISLDNPPFLHLKTKAGQTFYMNFANPKKTRYLYYILKKEMMRFVKK